ncbi:MAG: SLC13 family permease [Lautropia sp.]|nr:SLC13 family permease [Lautropia sp.]
MDPIQITLALLLFATVMFAWEKIPLAVTAIIVCLSLIVTGVLDAKTAFHGFVDSNVILFVGMFVVGGALFETGMANRIGGLVMRFAKTERQLIIAIMLITGLLSGLLSNTGTAAVLIPVVVGIANRSGFPRSRLLMPLVFASSIGGNLTLIGSTGNLIAQSALQSIGQEFHFFEYAKIGLPMLIVAILYFEFFGHKLIPTRGAATDADGAQAGTGQTAAAATPATGVAAGDAPAGSKMPAGSDTASASPARTTAPAGKAPARKPVIAATATPIAQTVSPWKQTMSLVILAGTVLGMVFERQLGVPLHVIAAIGAIVTVLTGVLTEKQAYKAIDSQTIFIFGGTLALATALEKTGAGAAVAHTIIHMLGDTPSPVVLLIVIFGICSVLTNFMSNTATAALLVPIGLSIAESLNADPRAVLMAVVIGCSCAYATPVGTPANTMVLVLGNYRFMDYVKAGVPLMLLMGAVSIPLLLFFFPFFP